MAKAKTNPARNEAGAADEPQAAIDDALDAGAVLPLGTAAGERRDGASTRSYAHPALTDRVLVRLAPDGLGAAEDLTLEFLGFAAAAEPVPVGVLRQQALGFPAWALVHDPANGHHALNLVKDIERLTRVAATKPGLAKEGFDDLAKRLAGAVPHFLPTFYEQAARVFLAAENTTLAAGFFSRAREAERAYSLAVDETAQGVSFLEFALAGALTAKALTEYSRALAARSTPDLAYAQFRRISLERTAGGLPPYSALPADLRRLAKAAGRDTVEEDVAFARELLPLPAMVRAAAGFWTSYRPQLLRAAKADAAVRGLMLAIIPSAAGEPGPEDPWLALLEETGAVAGLIEPAGSLPAEALPADGAAGWLDRFDAKQGGRSRWHYRNVPDRRRHKLLDLVERMAPRLRAEGTALGLCGRYYSDIDLIDVCLTLGLELADPVDRFSIDLDDWLSGVSDRDLTAFAADPRLRPYLYRGIGELGASNRRRQQENGLVAAAERVTGTPGLRSVLHDWLDDQAALLAADGLVDFDEHLRQMEAVTCPLIVAVNPEALRRMAALDVGGYLGHALRSGILDEYGWPALEEACVRLAGLAPGSDPRPPAPPAANAGRNIFQRGYNHHQMQWGLTPQWPYLVVQRDLRTVVVDASGIRLEHTVTVPIGQNVSVYNAILRYVDDQLLVAWNGHPDSGAYFTGDPARIFTDEVDVDYNVASLELPWGGRTFGGRPLTAGDPKWSGRGPVATDGTDYWAYIHHLDDRYRQQWVELDPRTGGLGRISLPGFFGRQASAGSGWKLKPDISWLYPAGPDAAGAPSAPSAPGGPLGAADGLIGFRTLVAEDGSLVCEGVDGRRVTLPAPKNGPRPNASPIAIASFPGAEQNLTLLAQGEIHLVGEDGKCVATLSAGQQHSRYARGTWCVPQIAFWSYLAVRDEAGSAALRALTDEDARTLAASAAKVPGSTATVQSVLPRVTSSKLRLGIEGYQAVAGECLARLRSMGERIEQIMAEPVPEPAAAPADRVNWNAEFSRARRGLAPAGIEDRQGSLPPGESLRVLAAALTTVAPPTEVDLAPFAADGFAAVRIWTELCQTGFVLPALAYRAASAGTGAAERESLLEFLRLWSAGPLNAPGTGLRLLTVVVPEKSKAHVGTVLETEHGRAIVLNHAGQLSTGDHTCYTVEFSRDGRFGALPAWSIATDLRPLPWPWADTPIEEFCDLAAAHGPVPVRPEQAHDLAQASGLSGAEARVLLAGLPTEATSYYEEVAAEVYEVLDLKPAAVKSAAKRFAQLVEPDCVALLTALLPERPESLWTDGPRLDAAADLWAALKGRQVPLPEELAAAAEKAVTAEIVQGVVNPTTARWLVGSETGTDDRFTAFTGDILTSAVKALVWLAYHLPAGDPLRAPLPQALTALRKRISDPRFGIQVGYSNNGAETAASFGYRLEPEPGTRDSWRAGPLQFSNPGNSWGYVQLYPADLAGADDPVLAALAKSEDFSWGRPKAHAVAMLLGDELEHLLNHGLSSNADAGQPFPIQDPTRSVPGLVSDAAGKLGLGADAAALYLMLLALPDPTERNQALWTGWKPARLKAARTELAGTDLVVSGSRPRAGRSLFLPGGWHALKAPHLPLETWKDPLYGLGDDGSVPLGLVAPRVPVPELFALAWNRVQNGDTPRYLELTTGKKR